MRSYRFARPNSLKWKPAFIRSQANVKIPLAKRCDDCQSRNISYRACCFAKSELRSEIEMEEEDLFERFMEEILASLEATSTEDESAKRVTTAI